MWNEDDDSLSGEICEIVVIENVRGLHARAAAKFVRTLGDYRAEVMVEKDETSVSGRSIMGLMMLAAGKGTQLKLCAMGPEAPEALNALADLVKRRFDEE